MQPCEDPSVLVPHRQYTELEIPDFEFALGGPTALLPAHPFAYGPGKNFILEGYALRSRPTTD